MKLKENINNEINLMRQNTNKNFNLAIIFCTIILFMYCYFGSFSAFESFFPDLQDLAYYKIIYHNFMAFILFFVLGILYTKLVMKENLSNFNFRVGNGKLGLKLMGIATLIVPLLALTTVLDPDMASTYPPIDFHTYSSFANIFLYFLSYLFYYIGWEFLFRGILLKGCQEKIGVFGAILLSTLVSSLIHTSIASFGKPMIETLSAIPAGLIFGFISYKTDSILYSLYIHALVGFLTDIFIFLI